MQDQNQTKYDSIPAALCSQIANCSPTVYEKSLGKLQSVEELMSVQIHRNLY